MVITMAKLRMAHASTHGARKPPGPKWRKIENVMKFINLSKKAAKTAIAGDAVAEKIATRVSKWKLLKNSITFLTRIKSVTINSMEMSGSKVSLSKLEVY